MISWKKLIEESRHAIISYKFLEDMFIYQQISDTIFEKTIHIVKKGNVYDGELVYKNNQIYLYLGFDDMLAQEVFIPIISEEGVIIIERNDKKEDGVST